MRILLLNDNPVVRKLVALSAQKTKDDLNVVWSVDEIEHQQYDLLIVDDAHYSDEVMAALKEKITYKSSLLMATRGAAVPAGFDKVINKPFLPTDLVELFIGIENTLPSEAEIKENNKTAPTEEMPDKSSIIDLDTLLDLDDDNYSLDDYELEDLLDEEIPLKTNVLDHEEVQELQDLLDDTDEIEDEFSFEDSALELSDSSKLADSLTMEDLDDDFLTPLEESKAVESEDDLAEFMSDSTLEDIELDELDEEEDSLAMEDDEFEELMDEATESGLDDDEEESDDAKIEEILSEEEPIEDDDITALLAEPLDAPLSDDEFDDLEQQIQKAVGELDADDLGKALDDLDLGGLDLEGLEDEFSLNDDLLGMDGLDTFNELEGLDELDSINEREIKLAIGEEVEDELEIRVGSGENSSLGAEALNEAMGRSPTFILEDELDRELGEEKSSPVEGVEALQALLKALSNEDVAKALKGLSINININFGNDK